MAFTADSKNLTLGAGEIRFARFQPGTYNHLGYRLLGNCPGFSLSRNSQKLEHRSSMGGLSRLDKVIDLDPSYKGTIKTDDFSFQNVALWSQAYIDGVTVTAATAQTYNIASPRPGNWYQIGQTAANIHGDRNISNVLVKKTVGGVVTYVLGTDYEVDLSTGLIYITIAGAITAANPLVITYDVGGSTRRITKSVTDTIEGEMRFTARNPAGPSYNMFIPRCSITPTSDLNLITENQFMEMSFEIATLQRDNYDHYIIETRSAVNP